MLCTPAGNMKSFSATGKLLEITHRDSKIVKRKSMDQTEPIAVVPKMIGNNPKKQMNTTAFTSVSREKKGNFRFPIRLCKHEFKYRPSFFVGSHSQPSWSMGKAQRTPRQRYVDYEICEKNPLFRRTKRNSSQLQSSDNDQKVASTSPGFFTARQSKGFSTKSTRCSPNQTLTKFNYSIVDDKDLSPVGVFNRTKISNCWKLDKQDLMNAEIDERANNEKRKPLGDVYIDMEKKEGRKPNLNHEQCAAEHHFNNFKHTLDKKSHIHSFQSYTSRKDQEPSSSPIYDLLAINLDKIREDTKRGNVKLHTYREKVRVRYDRAEPEATTRLGYDVDMTRLSHIQEGKARQFQLYKDRPEDLFPIVDPNLKRDSDFVMKAELKKQLTCTRSDPFSN